LNLRNIFGKNLLILFDEIVICHQTKVKFLVKKCQMVSL
jgi:hypothetical protein